MSLKLIQGKQINANLTGSLFGTASYALTAGTISSAGSFATTGSNTFIGNQTITGSANISGSLNVNNTLYVSGSSVGIGTSTPSDKLSISAGNILLDSGRRLKWADGSFIEGAGASSIMTFRSLGNYYFNGGNLGIGLAAPSASLHISGASSANLLRIDSPASSSILFVSGSGRVGIGTSTPSSSLDVRGVLNVQVSSGGYISPLVIENTGNASVDFKNVATFIGNRGNASNIDDNTNIGLQQKNSTVNNYGTFNFFNSANNLSAYFGAQYVSHGVATANLIFGTTNNGTPSEKMRITSSGSVGIGTPTPVTTFDVLASGSGGSFPIASFRTPASSGYISLYNFTSPFEVVRIESSNDISNGGSLRLYTRNGSSVVGEKMRITGTGEVGIGTTTPTNTLDIQSTATGSLRISGSGGSQITLVRPTAGLTGFVRYVGSTMELGTSGADPLNIFTNNTARISVGTTGNIGIGIGAVTPSARLQVQGSGATNSTTTFIVQNSTPTNLLSINDIGQVSFTSPTMSLAVSQSAFSISPIISASAVVGGQYYGVNITPTFFSTTGSQTETAFRVAATFTSSNATATGGTNIIADFGSTSAGSQLTVTDVTSGSIYMVNDVSGLPIIEATSDWGVKIYDFPRVVLEKTGSQVNINGTLQVSGSFILPLSQSATPQTGSAYWSGSLLFIYNGTRYMSASFF